MFDNMIVEHERKFIKFMFVNKEIRFMFTNMVVEHDRSARRKGTQRGRAAWPWNQVDIGSHRLLWICSTCPALAGIMA